MHAFVGNGKYYIRNELTQKWYGVFDDRLDYSFHSHNIVAGSALFMFHYDFNNHSWSVKRFEKRSHTPALTEVKIERTNLMDNMPASDCALAVIHNRYVLFTGGTEEKWVEEDYKKPYAERKYRYGN